MRREWVYSNIDQFRIEIKSLGASDGAKLLKLMELYETCPVKPPLPIVVWDYDAELKCLRHTKAAYKGRCLFNLLENSETHQKLIALIAYRKESQEVPENIKQTARQRLAKFKRNQ